MTIDLEGLDDAQQVELAKVVDSAVRRLLDPDGEELVLGWTRSTIELALKYLEEDGAWVQAATIREALQHDGYLTRDRVFKLGKYTKGRTLRGFSRPVNRIVEDMRENGEIPVDAVDLLGTSYQDGPTADGFRVPSELAQLVR